MLSDESLLLALHSLHKSGQRGPVLLLLSQLTQPAQTMDIREKGVSVGFRLVTQWNLSAILKTAANEGLVAQLKNGWKILSPGLKTIDSYYRLDAPLIAETRHALRDHLSKVSDAHRRSFLEEAINSFDAKASRAAIVLSWVGAAHILQEHIINNHLQAFNAAGIARDKRASQPVKRPFLPIRALNDFWSVGESELLQLCQDASILDKAEKQELQARLDLRNRCGHPNSIKAAEHTVAAHLESLLLHVYSKY